MLSNVTVDQKASVKATRLGQPRFQSSLTTPDAKQSRRTTEPVYPLAPLNAICSRVLRFSVIEETGETMAEIASLIAGELDRDLGSGLAISQPHLVAAITHNDLVQPMAAFEISVARQERVGCSIFGYVGQPDGTYS